MGHVPEPRPPRLRFDKHGMPLDFPTYMWQVYGKVVEDRSPQRMGSLQRHMTPIDMWDPRRTQIR